MREPCDDKLAAIAELSPQGLEGWHWAVTRGQAGRPLIDGEMHALAERARALGVTLKSPPRGQPR